MKIAPDFKEFIACANDNEVRFLVVGGYAVAFHGHPRYTKNLDIWIERSSENAQKVLKTLHDFGFESVQLTVDDFLEPDQVIQLGYPPLRIDILTTLSDVEFNDCYPNRQILDIDGITMPVIGIEDLLVTKRAAGRHQDLADVENLE